VDDREKQIPDSERPEERDDPKKARDDPQHQGAPEPERSDEKQEPALPDELQVP
jgi:hypothetical protein